MKRCALTLLLLSAFLAQPLAAQEMTANQAPEEQEMENIPQWLVDFSNLPAEERELYIARFNLAKNAYHKGEWVECIAQMAACELILRGNPSIWNLRACCLLEQGYYAEAETELKRVLEVQPNDEVTIMNLANVHMACGRYAESLAIVTRLREDMYLQHKDDSLLYALDYRALLCHIMLGDMVKAKAIAASVSPVADTPLYLYAKAAIALAEGKTSVAAHSLNVVKQIFANNQAYIPYERSLKLSGLLEKVKSTQSAKH